jgi:hypothetical protein
MDLQDFVKSALVDIVTGIQNAQGDPKVGQFVAPARFNGVAFTEASGIACNNHTAMTAAQFDVSVTAETEVGGRAGAKIRVIAFEAGAGAEASHKAQQASRIKFSVPVMMPQDKQS